MIPSLVVGEIRDALVEYLATTFALADDDVRDAVARFLTDEADGIFRGPFLQVRTPHAAAETGWTSPLDWMPEGFLPHAHQARAFERLSSARDHTPLPTIVTTGTGSGKTECFAYPALDHCARMRAAGHRGIKALILYPMNALASDQAGRLARLISKEPTLAGVTAGVYVGQAGRYDTMGPDHLIDRREAMRADPPDILLTNYKMLDFLLLRREDRDLWATNDPDTLRYVVLDELHTYDGAQGTDVAMLLRRLGATLGMAEPGRPLGPATPVATSATLVSGPSAADELRSFAGKVFGTTFGDGSVITEHRQSVDEACLPVNYLLPIPSPADVVELGTDDPDAVAAAFCRPEVDDAEAANDDTAATVPSPQDPVALGEALLAHPLTRAVLAAVGDRSRSWSEAVAEVVTRAPDWGRAAMRDPEKVDAALGHYLWLLSIARRRVGDRIEPLFSLEVQLWIREVSRVLRAVQTEPELRWRDGATTEPTGTSARTSGPDDAEHAARVPELPAVHCRRCGSSGWMALAGEVGDTLLTSPGAIYQATIKRSATQRVLLRANPDDPDARHYDPGRRRLLPTPSEKTVPVLATPDEAAAKASRCPACAESGTIRFLGLQVASLASVSINTQFGSPHVNADEQKLLAFTDSVQDASHRAAFFAGRTYRFNLRAMMSRVIADAGELALADLGDAVAAEATTAQERYGLVPPDLAQHRAVATTWTDDVNPAGAAVLANRLAFESHLELGLRSRVGRTLELTATAAAEVVLADADALADLVTEDLDHLSGGVTDATAAAVPTYLRGLLERLRLRGAIYHPFLDPYLADRGRQWHIWGGRPDGLPPFTPDQSRPTFATTASQGDFDSLTAAGTTPTWLVDWAGRCLGADASTARTLNQRTLALLAKESEAVASLAPAGAPAVYGLDPASIRVVDVGDDGDGPVPSVVRCDRCGHVHPVPPGRVEDWAATPCLRYRCGGHFELRPVDEANYYRRLYRSGVTRRVVTDEHTSLLRRAAREELEAAFKAGTEPDAPNVIAATPTLEMGIDIGDLSSVMLTSVPPTPASYTQRVGRAGRASGNSLITTFVRGDTHDLYYLAQPGAMIAGDIRPPNCYLDATETLQRQYVAYLIDRIADLTLDDAPAVPRRISEAMRHGLDPDGLFHRLIEASTLEPSHLERFLGLFAGELAPETVERLRTFAAEGIEAFVKVAVNRWQADDAELDRRRERINRAIKNLEDQAHRSGDDEDTLASLRGQRSAIVKLRREARGEYTLSGLERLGVLPNYTLLGETARLEATMWSRDENGEFHAEVERYERRGRLAVRELAPGNSFYAARHRHMIDALEVGSGDQTLIETWRLCPDCGYGAVEAPGEMLARCPRCDATGIGDTGARHRMLALRTAKASSSEEAARVYDESDDRHREHYDVITAVDADPASLRGAWQLTDRAFGAELVQRTQLRTINLGFADRRGERVTIDGAEHHATRFAVCAHCGAARDARDDRDGTRPERLHQGWCMVRSGRKTAQWEPLLLYEQLTTEAVRLLMPVSMFEVDERLASFTAALLIGLRRDFGGDPDHLAITPSTLPNRSGQGRYRFLVLYDTVPGGTGYLGRLADPDRVRSILEGAREVIARCPCRAEGRRACHRCLLGMIDRLEYDLVSRELALSLLDGLLEHWQPDMGIATVAEADISKVEESELERRFRVALQDWAAGTDDVTMSPVPGKSGRAAFELRIAREGETALRYRVDEQEGLTTSPSTIPDFVIHRVDTEAPDIAVYLDGYQFHASTENNHLAADASKRAGVRASGRLVWNLTWHDVKAFHEAISAEPPRQVPHRPLLGGSARKVAKQIHHATSGALDLATLDHNPVELLLDLLRHPDGADWRRLALSAVGGAAGAAERWDLDAGDIDAVVDDLARGREPSWPHAGHDLVATGCRWVSEQGLALGLVLDTAVPSAERWTAFAVIPDGDEAIDANAHRQRWRDWLAWANVAQFLGPLDGEQTAWIGAASQGDDPGTADLWVRTLGHTGRPSTRPSGPTTAISQDMADELDLIIDGEVRDLVAEVLAGGAPDFVAGAEVGDSVIEAAWPNHRVGVAPDDDSRSPAGWDVRPVASWDPTGLISRLSE